MSVFESEELSHYRSLRLSDEKRFRAMAIIAFLMAVFPIAVDPMGAGLFVWDLLPISDLSEQVRLLSPPLLGLGLGVAVFSNKRTRLALGIAGLLLTVLFLFVFSPSQLGYQELFSGVLDFAGRQPLVLFLGLVFVAAGADMRNVETVKPLARRHLIGGGALLVFLYLLPQRGQPFVLDILDLIGRLDGFDSLQAMMTGLVLLIFQLTPLLIGIVALAVGYKGSRPGLLGPVARFALPGLVLFLCFRLMVSELPPMAVLVQLRAALLIALVVGTASYALQTILVHLLADPHPPAGDGPSPLVRDELLREAVGRALEEEQWPRSILDSPPLRDASPLIRVLIRRRLIEFADDLGLSIEEILAPSSVHARRIYDLLTDGSEPVEPVRGLTWRLHRKRNTFISACIVSFTVSILALGWYAHDGKADLEWDLRPSTKAEQKFFGSMLPNYVQTVSKRNLEVASGDAGSEANQEVREKRTELLAEARDLAPELARSVASLLDQLKTVDADGRIWDNAIVRFNRKVRRLGFPFFMEAHSRLVPIDREGRGDKERIARLFWAVPHEVVEIRRFNLDDRLFAALHTRSMGWTDGHSFLGYVRPDEPFALIKLDNIERSVEDLQRGLERHRCGFALSTSHRMPLGRSDHLCGGMLTRALKAAGHDELSSKEALFAYHIAATEVHEVKHQWDADDIRIPDALYRLQPRASDIHLARFAKEVSAYLAELETEQPVVTLMVLSQLTGWLAQDRVRQNRYRYAAGLIINTLAQDEVMGPEAVVSVKKLEAFWELLHNNEDGLAEWVRLRARNAHADLLKRASPGPARHL